MCIDVGISQVAFYWYSWPLQQSQTKIKLELQTRL